MGQVLIGGPWILAIYGKGCQHRIFQKKGPSASEGVWVFKFWLYPGLLVLCICCEG